MKNLKQNFGHLSNEYHVFPDFCFLNFSSLSIRVFHPLPMLLFLANSMFLPNPHENVSPTLEKDTMRQCCCHESGPELVLSITNNKKKVEKGEFFAIKHLIGPYTTPSMGRVADE